MLSRLIYITLWCWVLLKTIPPLCEAQDGGRRPLWQLSENGLHPTDYRYVSSSDGQRGSAYIPFRRGRC